jgi:hypothetical protein
MCSQIQGPAPRVGARVVCATGAINTDRSQGHITDPRGRKISTYPGRALKWDWVLNASTLDLTRPKYELGALPVDPVAIPGVTPLV